MYSCGLILLKMLKQGLAGILFCWKCKNNVQLWFYSIENSEIKYGSEFVPLTRPKKVKTGNLFYQKF